MNRKMIISVATGTTLGMAILAVTNVAQAFNMNDMMNPFEWFDNDDDHYRYGRGYGAMDPTGVDPMVRVALPVMVVIVNQPPLLSTRQVAWSKL